LGNEEISILIKHKEIFIFKILEEVRRRITLSKRRSPLVFFSGWLINGLYSCHIFPSISRLSFENLLRRISHLYSPNNTIIRETNTEDLSLKVIGKLTVWKSIFRCRINRCKLSHQEKQIFAWKDANVCINWRKSLIFIQAMHILLYSEHILTQFHNEIKTSSQKYQLKRIISERICVTKFYFSSLMFIMLNGTKSLSFLQ